MKSKLKMQLVQGKVTTAALAGAWTGVLVGAAGVTWLEHARMLAHAQLAVLLVMAPLLAGAGWELTRRLVSSAEASRPELNRRQDINLEALQDAEAAAANNYAAFTGLVRMFAKAVDERTPYLRGHSERVAQYAVAIATELRIAPVAVERIRLAALLHDIGSLAVVDSLTSKTSSLTPQEYEIVKAHTVRGAAILRPIEALQDLIPGIELHHESLDGRGYPYGLKREDIPLMPRIIAVADSFDAMTTPRPYQAAMSAEYVLEVMSRLAGIRYDEAAVAALSMLVEDGRIRVGIGTAEEGPEDPRSFGTGEGRSAIERDAAHPGGKKLYGSRADDLSIGAATKFSRLEELHATYSSRLAWPGVPGRVPPVS